jgi:hypothetical protein
VIVVAAVTAMILAIPEIAVALEVPGASRVPLISALLKVAPLVAVLLAVVLLAAVLLAAAPLAALVLWRGEIH